jgi:NADH:ubiquinone oxidoreductase subunit E
MTISVCVGSSCHIKGSKQIIDRLRQLTSEYGLTEKIEIIGVLCMDNCMDGACVKVGERIYKLTQDTAEEFFKQVVLPDIR